MPIHIVCMKGKLFFTPQIGLKHHNSIVPCGSSPVACLYLAKNEAPEEEADGAGLEMFETLFRIKQVKAWKLLYCLFYVVHKQPILHFF